MRSSLHIMFAAWLLALVTTFAANAGAPAEAIAASLLDHMDAAEYTQAEAMFTAEMAAAVPADKLKQVWESLPAQVGAAQGRDKAQVETQSGSHLVSVPLQYAKAALVAKIAVNAEGKIAGFMIQPAPPAPAAAPAADAGFRETEFPVVDLPGTLAIPATSGKAPAVVLVHGSGPQDRDETIGPNRPFLDISRGLAEQGIAVLRYEKRTKARPQDFASGTYTMDEETTNDAVAAVAALRAAPGIDPDRVFVLGHS